jgi:hypothetical protein
MLSNVSVEKGAAIKIMAENCFGSFKNGSGSSKGYQKWPSGSYQGPVLKKPYTPRLSP